MINVTGDLTAAGVNTLEISGSLPGGSSYALIQYGGNFNGDATNFAISGATGVLTNDATTKTIRMIIASSTRGPTNVTWIGNSATNTWDTLDVTNWLTAPFRTFLCPATMRGLTMVARLIPS